MKTANIKAWIELLKNNKQFLLFATYEVSTPRDKDNREDKGQSCAQTNKDQLPTDFCDDESETPSKLSCTSVDEIEKYVKESSEGKVEVMYRAFNILDKSLQFLYTFFNSRSNEDGCDIISCSPDYLRVIYAVAALLKKWIDELLEN